MRIRHEYKGVNSLDASVLWAQHAVISSKNIIHLQRVAPQARSAIHAQNAWMNAPWMLHPRQTLSLHVQRPTRLHMQRGKLWVTVGDGQGDHFLQAGQVLHVPSGRVVLESCGADPAQWTCSAQPSTGLAYAWRLLLRDAGLAAALLARAGARLLLAARSAASKASTAQARIKLEDSKASGGGV
jgi:hypothetical protein